MAKKGKCSGSAYPPANATAVCLFHDGRLMNDRYIRKRGCLMHRKPCKHLRWLCAAQPKGQEATT